MAYTISMRKHKKIFQAAPQNMCANKVCYSSITEAEIVKDQQELLNSDIKLDIYRCISCGSWHLTRKKYGRDT